MTAAQINRLVAEVVNQLELGGTTVGVDQYLQIQDLLRRLPVEEMDEDAIKELISPILATNPQEQQHIYNLFEQVAARFNRQTPRPKPIKRKLWRRKIWLWGVLLAFGFLFFLAGFLIDNELFHVWLNPTYFFGLLILLASTIFLLRQVKASIWRMLLTAIYIAAAIWGNSLKNLAIDEAIENSEEISSNQEISVYPNDTIRRSVATLDNEVIELEVADASKVRNGRFSIDSLQFMYIAPAVFNGTNDSIELRLLYEDDPPSQVMYIFQLLEDIRAKEDIAESDPKRTMMKLQSLRRPFPHDLGSLYIDPKLIVRAEFYEQFEILIKLLIISFITLLFLSILKWRQKEEERLIAELESHDRPPLIWNIKIDDIEAISLENGLRLVLNQLRQRTLDERVVLDVKKTVKATAYRAGQITLTYKQLTRPGEYLLLIDRNNVDDHRAKLFDTLYQYFHQEEVELTRFFFDGDPRLCFNEDYPKGINIGELSQQYNDTRLIMMCSGHRLLNPLSGKLAKWTATFEEWQHRVILSPRATSSWGKKERRLGAIFQMLPASVKGLETALEQFEAKDPLSYEDALARVNDAALEAIRFEWSVMDTLECHYSKDMIEWIAACAVYPSLHWDLTIFIGQQLSTPDNNLLRLSNILELTRLPWFIEGKMPDEVRLELLDYLPEDKEQFVRQKLFQLFSDLPEPLPDSVAYDDYRMHLTLNELLLTDDPKRKEELERTYAQYLAAGYSADFAVLKYLEREESPLDFHVPDELRTLAAERREKGKTKPQLNKEQIPFWDILKELGAGLLAVIGVILVVGIISYFADAYLYDDLKEEIANSPFIVNVLFFTLVPFGLWIFWYWMVLRPVQYLRSSKILSWIRRHFPTLFSGVLERNNLSVLRWMAPVWLLSSVFTMMFDPALDPCYGDMVSYQEDKLCLSNSKDFIVYNERLAFDAFETSNFPSIDSINQLKFEEFTDLEEDSLGYIHQFVGNRASLVQQQHNRLLNFDDLDLFLQDTLLDYLADQSLLEFTTGSSLLERLDNNVEIDSIFPLKEYAANMAVEAYNRAVWHYNKYAEDINKIDELVGQQQTQQVFQQNSSGNSNMGNIGELQDEVIDDPWLETEFNKIQAIGFFYLAYLYNTADERILKILLRMISEENDSDDIDVLDGMQGNLLVTDDLGNPLEGVDISSEFINGITDIYGSISFSIPQELPEGSVLIRFEKEGFEAKSVELTIDESLLDREIQLSPKTEQREQIVGIFTDSISGYQGIRLNNRIVVPAEYNLIEKDARSGLFRVQKSMKGGLKMGYLDKNGKVVIPIIYHSLGFLKDGMIRAERERYGYLSVKGQTLIDLKFEAASDFEKGQAQVMRRLNGYEYSYLINKNGQCLRDCPPLFGQFEDTRDGQVYPTVQIGNQVWMAKNLNYIGKELNSWCYGDQPENCDEFGRLYTWESALNACPAGWRLPTGADVRTLLNSQRNSSQGGNRNEWMEGGRSGLGVKLGGVRNSEGYYQSLYNQAHYWTSTDIGSDKENSALFYIFYPGAENNYEVGVSNFGYKTDGLSCRCIKEYQMKKGRKK